MSIQFRPDPKPEKIITGKKKYEFKKEPTGEVVVFKTIATIRKHISFIDATPLTELTPRNFLHVLPKGQNKFPLFKLYEKNIILGTWEQHDLWDNGLREDLKKLPEWKKMFELEEILLEEYEKIKHEQSNC